MFCHSCGSQIADSIKYCPQRGVQIKYISAHKLSSASHQEKNPLAIWGFVIALVGLMLPLALVDLIESTAGIVMSSIAAKRVWMRGLALAGIITGTIGLIGALVIMFIYPDFCSDIWTF